ncbi:hypothetical protein pb186bvf_004667 [Paramecium bursaria]
MTKINYCCQMFHNTKINLKCEDIHQSNSSQIMFTNKNEIKIINYKIQFAFCSFCDVSLILHGSILSQIFQVNVDILNVK